MSPKDQLARLKSLLRRMSPGQDLEAMVRRIPRPSVLGQEADASLAVARVGLEKLVQEDDDRVSPEERRGIEAIILPRLRPVVLVRQQRFDPIRHELWAHLNDPLVHERMDPLLASVGRIELPHLSVPYGGTGFVVGHDLVMTNRHVARLFASGLGQRRLVYRPGDAAIDFHREIDVVDRQPRPLVAVRDVVLIHPYWDMALLRVEGLPVKQKPLTLSVQSPEDIIDREVVTIGFPAMDPRNDPEVQQRVFGGIYDVKRFQPGLARGRRLIRSFDHEVPALVHDCSTLGGNSGSAVIDIGRGEVVGLHFSGVYLEANYAVPSYELARDARVVDAGVNFARPLPAMNSQLASLWSENEGEEPQENVRGLVPPASQSPCFALERSIWTIPLNISVSLGLAERIHEKRHS